MASVVATVRPDDLNIALFLHVLGAMVEVGAFVLALTYLILAWRGTSAGYLRASFRVLLWVALPAYVVMRVPAQWLYSEEGLDQLPTDPAWVGIGFGVADIGLLLLAVATIIAGISSRRVTRGDQASGTAIRVTAALTGFLLLTSLVAVWAMTTKPV